MASKPKYMVDSGSHAPRDDFIGHWHVEICLCHVLWVRKLKDRDMSFRKASEQEGHGGSETDICAVDGSLCCQFFNNQWFTNWFFLLSLFYLVCPSIKSQDDRVCVCVRMSIFVFMCVHGYVCVYMSAGLCKCAYVRICVSMCLWVIMCVLYKIGFCDRGSPGLTMLQPCRLFCHHHKQHYNVHTVFR